jgi:hypothetical protein
MKLLQSVLSCAFLPPARHGTSIQKQGIQEDYTQSSSQKKIRPHEEAARNVPMNLTPSQLDS